MSTPSRPLPPPPPKVLSNAYTLFFDGAFRRATGKAGEGLVLVNPEGEVIMKEQVTLDGSTSNNEAEYDVLISGLKICLAQKIQRLMVKGDALLIVKQILGIWACKNERLRTKVTSIQEVQLYHIPRKENEDANLLAQQAVSNQDKAHVVIAAIALKDPQYAAPIEQHGSLEESLEVASLVARPRLPHYHCHNILEKGVENPYQELKKLLEGKPSSKKKGHAPHEGLPSKEREGSEPQDESMKDVAPRRKRAQRSPTPTKRKRSPHSPHRRESKREEKSSRKKKERKRSPSSPSSSPSSSSNESSRYSSQEKQRRGHRRSYAAWNRSSKLKKFKEGGKNISFLTYDGTFGATNKVLAFIQQFDAAFGDEGFTESSKLRHVAMHFQKSAKQWWASLRANGEVSKIGKALRASIMKKLLAMLRINSSPNGEA
ncbi:hypothetical protein L7F22_035648 [Adiantum nelumboides]|nr:hypothetical protein [Adiantum nelumboides]